MMKSYFAVFVLTVAGCESYTPVQHTDEPYINSFNADVIWGCGNSAFKLGQEGAVVKLTYGLSLKELAATDGLFVSTDEVPGVEMDVSKLGKFHVGSVTINNVTTGAYYQLDGITHSWHWENDYSYMFQIKADGWGYLYEFPIDDPSKRNPKHSWMFCEQQG